MNVFYSRTVRLSRFHIYFQSPFQWLHCATHMIISVNIQEQKEQFNFDNDVVIFVRHLANTKLITFVFFNTLFMGTTMSTLVTFLSSYLSIIFQLEKQILATKSQSSNDLFSSAVLLLQVIFFQSFSMFVTFPSSYLSIIFHSLASLFLITQHLRLISFIVA